jgi:hypothetical protein
LEVFAAVLYFFCGGTSVQLPRAISAAVPMLSYSAGVRGDRLASVHRVCPHLNRQSDLADHAADASAGRVTLHDRAVAVSYRFLGSSVQRKNAVSMLLG